MTANSNRIIPALLAAAGLPAFVMTAQTMAENLEGGIGGIVVDFGVFFAIAAVPTLVLGLPMFLLLNAFDKVRWWTSLPAGLLIGLATFQTLNYLSAGSLGLNDYQYQGLISFGLIGAASAGAAWLVWRAPWRR